jgi:hypothetical protein
MEPEIVDVRGVQIELILWRGTDNLFEAELKQGDGEPISLVDSDVTMTIVERAGGPTRFTQTNEPDDHTDAANGLTRFAVPATPTFDDVTGQRSYTWKYQVVRRNRTTGGKNIHFWGDVRVTPPPAAV